MVSAAPCILERANGRVGEVFAIIAAIDDIDVLIGDGEERSLVEKYSVRVKEEEVEAGSK